MSLKLSRRNIFIGIILVLFVGLVAVVAYQRSATTQRASATCNDYACTNFKDGTNWAIRNCQGNQTDGTTYTCSEQGKTGSCGNTTYCCPGPGLLWTTDLTKCTQTASTAGCCNCPTPTPYTITSPINGPCMTHANCTSGNVCIFDKGYGWVCRNPACFGNTSGNCAASTPTPTITPTPTLIQVRAGCNEYCLTTPDCQSGYECVVVSGAKQCRNSNCIERSSCVCTQ